MFSHRNHLMSTTFLILLCVAGFGLGSVARSQTQSAIRNEFRRPAKRFRPMVRWWWPGGDVTDEEIQSEIGLLDSAGFAAGLRSDRLFHSILVRCRKMKSSGSMILRVHQSSLRMASSLRGPINSLSPHSVMVGLRCGRRTLCANAPSGIHRRRACCRGS
jgi:hypothetical protein